MPIRVSRINSGDGLKTLSVTFGEETLNIKYSRKKYTPKLEREMQTLMKENLPGGMLSKFLISLIEAWDVVDYHPDDVEKATALELQAVEDKKILSQEDMAKKGIRFVDVPITEETLNNILSIEAQSKIVEALAEDQRPNEKPSDFTSDI